jgi:WD40 repeat protein
MEVIREDSPVVSSHLEIFERSCCPSAMASSQQGNMVFVAYTDNTVQMFDTRAPGQSHHFRTGGHGGLVKSIFVGSDETVVFTGGMDGTMRLWDVGKRAVIKVYGTEDKENPINYSFHTQTIWSILPDIEDSSTIWSGGRDGKIFITDIEEGRARCLLDGTKPITCIAND